MNFFEKIIYFLQVRNQSPTNYGPFHLTAIAICIALTIILCVFFKDAKSKTFNRIMFITWLVMVIFEIYKQLVFSFNYDGTTVEWDYQWYAFPFQFCSSPIFVLPFIFLFKEGKIKDSAMAFIATFSMFAGLCVYLYPNDVFSTSLLGVQIQTMVHHGLQLATGIYVMVYNRKKANIKFFLKGIIVFVILVAVALTLDIIIPKFTDETFNMYFISPYFPCTLPILNNIYNQMPYIVFLAIYILGFSLGAIIAYYIQLLFIKLFSKRA